MANKNNSRFSNTIKGLTVVTLTALMVACGGGATSDTNSSTPPPAAPEATAPLADLITADEVTIGPIDQGRVAKGKEIYEVKCQACHSLGTNRVVGPGWEGVVEKREPAWIMNMIVHTDAMLESDEVAQQLLEECLVRMPNQNLTTEDARDVLEFMRTLEPT